MNRAVVALFAAVALGVAPFAGTGPATAASEPGVRIVAIYFDSPGADRGGNASLDAEWVKIRNTTGRTRTLTGWTLRDPSHHVYRFPTFRLAAGAAVRVHTGDGGDTAHDLYWGSGWYVWNNDGDTATLRNATGTFIDRCAYTASADPQAYC